MKQIIGTLMVIFITAISINEIECKEATVIFINSLADRGLGKLVKKFKSMDQETVPLPDIDYTIRKKYPHVRLVLKQGTFGSLYTWKRTGDVFLTMDGNSISVNLTTTFENAVVHFKDFLAEIGTIDLGDELTIFLRKNKIHMQATLLLTENGFKVSLDDFALTEFGDIHVERRMKGELQSEASNSVLSFVFNSYSEKLRVKLGALLRRLVENRLKKYDLLS